VPLVGQTNRPRGRMQQIFEQSGSTTLLFS
jgi:hypothetical protein